MMYSLLESSTEEIPTSLKKQKKNRSAVEQSTKTHEYKLGCSWLRIYKNPLAFFVVSKFGPFFRETSVIKLVSVEQTKC